MAEETPFTIERNFSFIIEGKLAGSHKPGNHPSALQTDLQILKEKFKITAIVSLSESPLDENEVKKFGFEYLYLPVRDYYPPSIEQMCQLVKFVNSNQCTLIHCNAGMGRTGTGLAACLIANGMPAEEAIKKLRKMRKGSIQTFKQEDGLKEFEKYLKEKNFKF